MSLLNTDILDEYDVSGGYAASYAISFRYFDEADIIAVLTINEGEDDESTETLILATNYTLSEPGDTGTLTKVGDWTAADKLTIYREVSPTQPIDLENGGKIDAEVVEKQLDRTIAMIQQLQYGTAFTNPESVAISTFMSTLLDDVNASTALTTLGISTFIKTLLDDATALAARTTLEITLANLGINATAAEVNYLTDRSSLSKSTTVDYTILDDDGYSIIFVTAGASNKTMTLPTAADNTGRKIKIMKVDDGAGYAIVDGEAAETINGTLTWEITEQYGFIEVQSNGTGWYVVNKNRCTVYRDENTTQYYGVGTSWEEEYSISGIKAGAYRATFTCYLVAYGGRLYVTLATTTASEDDSKYTTYFGNQSSENVYNKKTFSFDRSFASDVTLYINAKASAGTCILSGASNGPIVTEFERVA